MPHMRLFRKHGCSCGVLLEMRDAPSRCQMQELSILDYPLVHHPAPIKAAAALLSAVSFQTKTLRPYLDEIKVLACSHSFKLSRFMYLITLHWGREGCTAPAYRKSR